MKENRYCKGCCKEVSSNMWCECGEFSLSLSSTYSDNEMKRIDGCDDTVIESIEDEFEIDCEVQLPNVIKCDCPNCGSEVEFLNYPLNYPNINSECVIGSYCDNCETDLELPITLRMSVEYDKNNIKK